MPEPQPAWAQQYNYKMQPIWARKFEPPGISGSESQDVIETLIRIARYTNQDKYLKPIPSALAYLKKSQLPDGSMARYYELRTNRPLYMSRQGKEYSLAYDDSNLPDHYGWKVSSRLDDITRQYEASSPDETREKVSEAQVREIVNSLDEKGRWISTYTGERLVGQPKFALHQPYISSAVFSQNMETLSQYLAEAK
jgi:squalene cyclase